MFIATYQAERLDREINDYYWALINAAFIDHENIVRLLLDRGVDNYDSALRAEWNSHENNIWSIRDSMN